MSDLPDRSQGQLGESAGETLMRALDNIGRLEEHFPGARVTHVAVVYAVRHPPSDEDPFGAHTYGIDNTPGMGEHEVSGLLRFMAEDD